MRRDGSTTRQMLAAPQGSVFVWVTDHLHYPTDLAKRLGRKDLVIVGPSWLKVGRYQGLELKGLVLDHAIDLNSGVYDHFIYALHRVRHAITPPDERHEN